MVHDKSFDAVAAATVVKFPRILPLMLIRTVEEHPLTLVPVVVSSRFAAPCEQ